MDGLCDEERGGVKAGGGAEKEGRRPEEERKTGTICESLKAA